MAALMDADLLAVLEGADAAGLRRGVLDAYFDRGTRLQAPALYTRASAPRRRSAARRHNSSEVSAGSPPPRT